MASHFHILIVEDEPLIVEILRETLEEQYRVSSANTVEEARECLRASHVDVALVDSVLPDGHGDEVAAYAKAYGAAVIQMSGYLQEIDDLDRPYLMKPFGREMLLSTIDQALLETAH
jgi:DNA-binding NtrC family response regulator